MTRLRRWWSDEDQKSQRRPRIVLAVVVAVCVTVTGIAVTGAGNAPPGLKFTQAGHWVYNSVLGTAFHVDGGSKSIDAEVSIPGLGPGSTVVQTDGEGYVLSREQTVEFGKSDLSVADRMMPAAAEDAVGLESAGAAYAVYPKAGKIVRFGDQPVTLEANEQLGSSVVTRTGTLWVHQPGGGQLCQLPLKATRLTCTASTQTGHRGGLTMVGDRPVFVDTTANAMTPVSGDGLGRTTRLDIDLPDDAVIAGNDLGGRIAVLNPGGPSVHMVDAASALDGEVVEPSTSTRLEPGQYERVATAGKALVLIEEKTGTVVTVDERGDVHESEKLPEPSRAAKANGKNKDAKPGMFRGDDGRVYVDSAAGEHVMVVEDDGEITPVEVTGDDGEEKRPTPTQTPTQTPTTTPTPEWTPVPKKRDTPEPPRREPKREPKKSPDPVPASRPGAPSSVSGKAGVGQIAVSWGPASGNGSRVTAYELSWQGGSKRVPGSARSSTVTGLKNGSSYTITVRAVNRAGAGPGVSTKRLVPGGRAEAPTGFKVTVTGSDEHTFSWKQPSLNGGRLVEYRLIRDNGANTKQPTGTSQTWGGLIDGKQYHFTVQAITTSPSGEVLVGKQAAMTFTVDYDQLKPTVTAKRGPGTTYNDSCQEDDGCAFVQFEAAGLEPDTEYNYYVWSTDWGEFNGVTLTTDENGAEFADDRFACNPEGQQVWIVVEDSDGNTVAESNKFTWPA